MTGNLNPLGTQIESEWIMIHTHLRKMKPNRRMAAELVAVAMCGRDAIVAIHPVTKGKSVTMAQEDAEAQTADLLKG
jgi:hypothetical protein